MRQLHKQKSFLPPYSPDLMPLEEVFNQVKKANKSFQVCTAPRALLAMAFSMVTFEDCIGYIRHCGYIKVCTIMSRSVIIIIIIITTILLYVFFCPLNCFHFSVYSGIPFNFLKTHMTDSFSSKYSSSVILPDDLSWFS